MTDKPTPAEKPPLSRAQITKNYRIRNATTPPLKQIKVSVPPDTLRRLIEATEAKGKPIDEFSLGETVDDFVSTALLGNTQD